MYTNLRVATHKYNTKHTHSSLSHATKHGALLAHAAADEADFTLHKKRITLTNVQFTRKQ
jgi:hypothetical protein